MKAEHVSCCPGCHTQPYFYLTMPQKLLVSFCLCGVTRHDTKAKKR